MARIGQLPEQRLIDRSQESLRGRHQIDPEAVFPEGRLCLVGGRDQFSDGQSVGRVVEAVENIALDTVAAAINSMKNRARNPAGCTPDR